MIMISKALCRSNRYQVDYISRRLYMKKCTSCGFIVNNDIARFCPECGKPVVEYTPENTTPAVDPAPAAPAAAPVPPVPSQPVPDMSQYTMSSVRNEADFNTNVPQAPIPPSPVPPVQEAAPNYNQAPVNNQYYAPNQGNMPMGGGAPIPGPAPAPSYDSRRPDITNMSRSDIVAALDRNIDMSGKALGSPWFLITVISFLGTLLMEIITTVYGLINYRGLTSSIYSDLFSKFGAGNFDLDYYLNRVSGSARVGYVFGIFITIIPMILSGIGLLIMFCNHKKRPIPRAGFGLAKTNVVFKIVIWSIVIALVILVCIISMFFGNSLFSDIFGIRFSKSFKSSFVLFVVIVMFIFIGIFIAAIFYYAGLLKSLNVARKAASEGKCPKNKVSIYCVVINFMATLVMLISIILSLSKLGSVSSILSLCSSILLMVFYLASAISLIILRSSLTELPGIN